MLVSVISPLIDVRSFLDVETGRLDKPQWPMPKLHERPFVRGFGPARRRRRGGLTGWIGEDYFCDFSAAARFRRALPGLLLREPRGNGQAIVAKSIYRRLFLTGRGGARFDFTFVCDGIERLPAEGQAAAIENVIASILSLAVQPARELEAYPLIRSFPLLSRSFLNASTRKTASVDLKPWWSSCGAPAVICEIVADSAFRFGKPVSWTTFTPLLDTHRDWESRSVTQVPRVELWFKYVRFAGVELPTWVIRSAQTFSTGWKDEARLVRRARVHLARLHSEIEFGREVLRLLEQGLLTIDERGKEQGSQRLQFYLTDLASLLTAQKREGIEYDPVFDALQPQALGTDSDFAALAGTLASARRTVRSRLRRSLESKRARVLVRGQAFIDSTVNPGGAQMKQQNVVIRDHASASNIVQAESIERSFNQVAASRASDELKGAMKELAAAVDKLLVHPELDPSHRERIERSYETLAKEASASNPDSAWTAVSANGLKAAAATVAALAPTIASVVDRVVSLLHGAP